MRRGLTRNTVIVSGTIALVALIALANGDLPEDAFLVIMLAGFGGVLVVAAKALKRPPVRAPEVSARPVRRPVLPRAAVVVDERSEVSGRGAQANVRTDYFMTLEFVNGARAEYRVDAQLAARCTREDAGAAFIERGSLASFHRIKI